MPCSTLDDLLEAYSTVSTVNRAMLERFTSLAGALQRHGIRFVVLKGADVLSRLYGMRGMRPLADVDLLVDAADLPAIDAFLTGRGFVQQIDGNPSYVSSDLTLSLDLVTSLWYLDEQGLADLWARAITRPFAVSPMTITCLSTEDLLIHLTAYAVIHRGQLSPAFAQDVRLLVDQESPNWTSVVTRALDYDLRVPLHHGLSHVVARFPAAGIPQSVLSQLAPRNRREKALAWLFHKLVTRTPLPDLGHFLLWVTRRRGMRWSWLRCVLFPSRTFLTYRYGNAGLTAPCGTRLQRLGHLTVAGLVLSGRLMLRLMGVPGKATP